MAASKLRMASGQSLCPCGWHFRLSWRVKLWRCSIQDPPSFSTVFPGSKQNCANTDQSCLSGISCAVPDIPHGELVRREFSAQLPRSPGNGPCFCCAFGVSSACTRLLTCGLQEPWSQDLTTHSPLQRRTMMSSTACSFTSVSSPQQRTLTKTRAVSGI